MRLLLSLYGDVRASWETPYIATAPSIQVIKKFNYRGTVRNFSNRYHFHGGTPADSTHWTTLSDAVVTAEKAIYLSFASNGATILETVGYAGGSDIPVFSKTYTTDGTGLFSSTIPTPGDSAALIRYSTADRSSKNHPVYCFNFYHACTANNGTLQNDQLNTGQKAAMVIYAADWITGFSDGANTYVRSRPNGNICTGSLVEPLLTHRDLPH